MHFYGSHRTLFQVCKMTFTPQLRYALLILTCILITACSPGYVIRAAYEESKILLGRQDISDALLDPLVPEELKEKLRYVSDARTFTRSLSLDPGETFTKYSAVDRDVLVWVVMGSEKDSFTLRGWWFPIVGTVPYKGFFEKEDAVAEAQGLADEGYETWVRGADAFSTLGWFNDPVLSTTLKHPIHDVVETVIHETLHTTVWIPGHVDYNESLANYVGLKGSILFFADSLSKCADNPCKNKAEIHLSDATEEFNRSMELSGIIEKLYADLNSLYEGPHSREEKLVQREVIFNASIKATREKYPTLRALQSVNNAEIMQLKLYFTQLSLFDTLFRACGEDFGKFVSEIVSVKEKLSESESVSPFEITRRLLEFHPKAH